MRLPRFRLRIRWTMIAMAYAAVALVELRPWLSELDFQSRIYRDRASDCLRLERKWRDDSESAQKEASRLTMPGVRVFRKFPMMFACAQVSAALPSEVLSEATPPVEVSEHDRRASAEQQIALSRTCLRRSAHFAALRAKYLLAALCPIWRVSLDPPLPD